MKGVWICVVFLVGAAMSLSGAESSAATLRTWTSASGKSVEAGYVGLKQGKVKLRSAEGEVISINARSLSAQDQEWIKQEEARRNAPAGIRPPAKPYELPVFAGGKLDGYHAVYRARNFDACMDARGVIGVYPKENGARIGKPMRLYEDCFYRDDENEYQHARIAAFQNCPAPTKQPKALTLTGLLRRDVPFSVTYEFSEEGIKAFGACQDSPKIKYPTVYRLRVKIPPSHSFDDTVSLEERREILKDWKVLLTPVTGKGRTFPYWESVRGMGGRNKQVVIDAAVYGERKVCFKARSPNNAPLSPSVYTGKCPWQGYSVSWIKDKSDAKGKSLYMQIAFQ